MLIATLMVGVACGYVGSHFVDAAPISDRPTSLSPEERQEHYRLLRKHGLLHDVAIIYEDQLGRYYIRGGRRIKFQ